MLHVVLALFLKVLEELFGSWLLKDPTVPEVAFISPLNCNFSFISVRSFVKQAEL